MESVLDVYTLNPDLVYHKLDVSFEDEAIGLDLGGLTKEMFTHFFVELLQSEHFEGNFAKVPALDHRFLFNGKFDVIGRIISHAFVLVEYFPTSIALPAMTMIMSGTATDDHLVKSFVRLLGENDGRIITECLDKPDMLDDPVISRRVIRILGTNHCMQVPKKHDLKEIVLSVARLKILCAPLWSLNQLWRGLTCYPVLWQGIEQKCLRQLYDQLQPNAEKILACIEYEYSSNMDLRFLEEMVCGYFERFISSLNEKQLTDLLVFWTASDCILGTLKVAFNSLDGIEQRPQAHTCSNTLSISRTYMSERQLSRNVMAHIASKFAEVFDAV